jgi:hypothetical protein
VLKQNTYSTISLVFLHSLNAVPLPYLLQGAYQITHGLSVGEGFL